jgi:hypothetical protein
VAHREYESVIGKANKHKNSNFIMIRNLNILIVVGLFLCSCVNADPPINTGVTSDTMILTAKDTSIAKPYQRADEGVILEQKGLFKITGDSSIRADRIYSVMVKFEPYVSFDDYNVDSKFSGKNADIDYNSNRVAKEYKTVISREYKREGVNFAGHYCFVIWPNGTSSEFAIIDVIDGKVYNCDGCEAAKGYDFRENSRLIISNPPDSDGFYDANTAFWHPELLVWDEINKRIITMQPGFLRKAN